MSVSSLKTLNTNLSTNLRADFPIFKNFAEASDLEPNSKPPLVYLDNAATTQMPQVVLDEIINYYTRYKANVGRGSGQIASIASDKIDQTRQKVHHFLQTDPTLSQAIFTSGSTDSFNLLALALYKHFKKLELMGFGDKITSNLKNIPDSTVDRCSNQKNSEQPKFQTNFEVIVSQIEHHSNFLVWPEYFSTRIWTVESAQPNQPENLASVDSEVDLPNKTTTTASSHNQTKKPVDDELELTWPGLKKLLTPQTRILALSHCSNLTGQFLPIKEIIAKVRQICPGICVVIDGSQAVAHQDVNVEQLDCDFYIFSAHKMFGPTGCGVLWGHNRWLSLLEPPKFGGGMVQTVNWLPNSHTELENSDLNCAGKNNLDQQKCKITNFKPLTQISPNSIQISTQLPKLISTTTSVWAELPHSWEAGTGHIAGIIGLGAAIDYLETTRQRANLGQIELELSQYCQQQLSQISDIYLISPISFDNFTTDLASPESSSTVKNFVERSSLKITKVKNYETLNSQNSFQNLDHPQNQSPIITFYHAKISSFDLAQILSLSGICLRSGSFCCQPLTQALPELSLLRVSLSFYNTWTEIDFFITQLKLAIEILL